MQLTLGNIVPLTTSPARRNWELYSREHSKQYARKHIRGQGGKAGPVSLNLGFAGEHYVVGWLLSRQIEVAMLCNKQSHHDLVALIEDRWWTIQVKIGAINTKTGHLKNRSPRSRIWSDIVALVDLEANRIQWVPMREALPTNLALADLRPQL